MRAWRKVLLLALLAALAAMASAPLARATPFVPTDDGDVLERLPVSPLDPSARRLQALRGELAQQPNDVDLAVRLARLYIAQGRALADPRYYGYAQGALAPWWSAAEPPPPVLVLRATIRQHDHDFPSALQDLSRALRADPSDPQAWLTQATVLQVQGDYDGAAQSCMQVLQLANPLVAITCLSGVDSLRGAAQQSYDRLRRAFAQQAADPPARLWALTTLAEITARSGQAEVAAGHFEEALALGQRDDYLMAAYADFLLDQRRPAAVRDLLGDATRADALLLRLALAEQALASPELDAHLRMLGDRFAAGRLRGDTVHRREEARAALWLRGDARTALQLARDNWGVQREPADARILLESALAAGDRSAAAPVLDFVARTGLQDVALAALAARLRETP